MLRFILKRRKRCFLAVFFLSLHLFSTEGIRRIRNYFRKKVKKLGEREREGLDWQFRWVQLSDFRLVFSFKLVHILSLVCCDNGGNLKTLNLFFYINSKTKYFSVCLAFFVLLQPHTVKSIRLLPSWQSFKVVFSVSSHVLLWINQETCQGGHTELPTSCVSFLFPSVMLRRCCVSKWGPYRASEHHVTEDKRGPVCLKWRDCLWLKRFSQRGCSVSCLRLGVLIIFHFCF